MRLPDGAPVTHLLLNENSTVTYVEKRSTPAYQCCGSGMFVPDPDFISILNPDLGSKATNEEGKKMSSSRFLLPYILQKSKFKKN
jgi:hypothetical protein